MLTLFSVQKHIIGCIRSLYDILDLHGVSLYAGSPLLVLQQQKKVAEELNRVIKAMNNGNDNVSSLEKTETLPSDVSSMTENPRATSSQNMQVSTKNLMINSLNSAGSDMEDSVTGDSTSDLHTERYNIVIFTVIPI